ncbi:MAG TPA: DUF5663 domain-containing protein [Candidatus Paceibacterota bacterium]
MQDDMMKTIAADLGVSSLPEAEQQEAITQFGTIALKASSIAVIEALPMNKRQDFLALSEAGDPAQIQAFLDREVPNHAEITQKAVAEELRRFKEYQKTAA